MSHTKDDDLALAARHVAQGQIIVARQRERIERLKALGCSTLDHEQTLRVFANTLQIFIDHERELREGRKTLATRAFSAQVPGTRRAGP